jgi:hypothetical protein
VAAVWKVDYLPAAANERSELPPRERQAIDNAVQKLEVIGPDLPAPHSSAARGVPSLRELRPRSGRSRWRPLYRRVGDRFVIAAIAPDGKSSPRGFAAACDLAAKRLKELEQEQQN